MSQRHTVLSDSEYESVVGYSRAVRTGPFIAVAGTTVTRAPASRAALATAIADRTGSVPLAAGLLL